MSGSGLVVRDSVGRVLVSKSVLHDGVGSAFEAEALSCQEAIKLGLGMNRQRIIFEGYSLTIIKKCVSQKEDLSVLSAYIKNIKRSLVLFPDFAFQQVYRSANIVANIIVVESLKRKEVVYLEREVPHYAVRTLEKDWLRNPD